MPASWPCDASPPGWPKEGEIPADPFLGIKAPKIDTKIVEPLTDDELRALLKACTPPKGATPAEASATGATRRSCGSCWRPACEPGKFRPRARRPEPDPVLRPSARARAAKAGSCHSGRTPPWRSTVTPRPRRPHALADTPTLCFGDRGQGSSYDGLRLALGDRAEAAGIPRLSPAPLRHTAAPVGSPRAAQRGRPDGRRRMVKARHDDRYTRTASERAADEARGLNLGDL